MTAGKDGEISSGQKSTGQALENLDINMVGDPGLEQASDLRLSEIKLENQPSNQKGEDDIAEMEKLLKSGGGFGGKNLGESFKKIRNEIGDAAGNSPGESDLDLPIGDSSKLMESEGQNTFVQNQINQLTESGNGQAQVAAEVVPGPNDQSDSNIDIEGLTESQLAELQQQAEDMGGEEEEDDDVIDVDNPEDLAKKGLRRIQIEGDEQEYLLDNEGNIYNLQGEFVGTTGGEDGEEEGDTSGIQE